MAYPIKYNFIRPRYIASKSDIYSRAPINSTRNFPSLIKTSDLRIFKIINNVPACNIIMIRNNNIDPIIHYPTNHTDGLYRANVPYISKGRFYRLKILPLQKRS